VEQTPPTVDIAAAPPTVTSEAVRNESRWLEALRRDTIDRHRVLAWQMAILLVSGGLFLPLLGGDELALGLLFVSLFFTVGAYIAFLVITRDRSRYMDRWVAWGAYFLAMMSAPALYYFGPFSAAPALMMIGLVTYSIGGPFRHTLGVLIIVAGSHAIIGGLVVFEVIADRGLVRADNLPAYKKVIIECYIIGVYVAAYLLARGARRSTKAAVLQLESAVREITRRSALLQEARQELARARRASGPGRFTGQVLGSYQLGDVIGRGGMGEVYDAEHVDTGEPAALKTLHLAAMSNPDYRARFLREIRAVEAIESPNVVRVLEVSSTAEEIPFLVMEKLSGASLSQRLRNGARMKPAEVAQMVTEIAGGLAEARAADVVHRDLKPGNLFRAEDGDGWCWKILDFGVSKLAGDGTTLTHGAVGTPAYMAPEQARAREVDHRADIHALAACAYRALTGRPAFTGPDVGAILYAVANEMPPRPSDVADLPRSVDDALIVAFAKRPEDRYETAEELAESLSRAVDGELDGAVVARAQAIGAVHPWL
jgi:serine/threonine-protein kinase